MLLYALLKTAVHHDGLVEDSQSTGGLSPAWWAAPGPICAPVIKSVSDSLGITISKEWPSEGHFVRLLQCCYSSSDTTSVPPWCMGLSHSLSTQDEERSVATTCKAIPKGCLDNCHQLSVSFAQQQVELIHNHYCFSPGQADILGSWFCVTTVTLGLLWVPLFLSSVYILLLRVFCPWESPSLPIQFNLTKYKKKSFFNSNSDSVTKISS